MSISNTPEQYLRFPAVQKIVGLSRASIYRLASEGSFPKPVLIGKRTVGWPESVIAAYLASRPTVDWADVAVKP